MSKIKNEKTITLAGSEILLRPTFANCEALESDLGFGLPVLAHNLSQKILPGMIQMAKVIYHCQAQKVYTKDDIWEMVQSEGMLIMTDILIFVGSITAGDKFNVEKKNQAQVENQI